MRRSLPIASSRTTRNQEQLLRAAVTVPTPVWPNLPTSTAFVPLVFLVTGIAAGLYAWADLHLTESLARWGLWGHRVWWASHIHDNLALGSPAPAYVWSMAAALALPIGEFWRLTLPSFTYAVLSLLLIYRIARDWYTPSTGLLACFLFGINHVFLFEVHAASPAVCFLFWSLLTIWSYQRHARTEDTYSHWLLLVWLSLTMSFLSGGWNGLWLILLGATLLLYAELHRRRDFASTVKQLPKASAFWLGLIISALAVLPASFWLTQIEQSDAVLPEPAAIREAPLGMDSVVAAMPATAILAGFGLFLAAKDTLRGNAAASPSVALTFWALLGWLATGVSNDTSTLLFVLVPLIFLATRTFLSILKRNTTDREVLILLIASLWSFLILRSGMIYTIARWVEGIEAMNSENLLRLHLGIDALLLTAGLAIVAYRLTARRERYRRVFVGSFALLTLILSGLPALARHQPAKDADAWLRAGLALDGVDADSAIHVGTIPPPIQVQFLMETRFPGSAYKTVETLPNVELAAREISEPVAVLLTNPSSQLPTSIPRGNNDKLVLSLTFTNEVLAIFTESPAATP